MGIEEVLIIRPRAVDDADVTGGYNSLLMQKISRHFKNICGTRIMENCFNLNLFIKIFCLLEYLILISICSNFRENIVLFSRKAKYELKNKQIFVLKNIFCLFFSFQVTPVVAILITKDIKFFTLFFCFLRFSARPLVVEVNAWVSYHVKKSKFLMTVFRL